MTDLEDKIRDALQDPRWELPAWPDPMRRVRRAAARQRAKLAAAAVVLLAAVVTPLALLPGLVTHSSRVKPSAIGTARTPSARSAASSVPSWAKRLHGEVAYKCSDAICLMRPDGTGKRLLPGGGSLPYPQWDPAWSPDGRQLSFRGYYGSGDGQYDLYAVDANGCHLTRLTHRMNGTSSSWSPTGRQIVLSAPLGIYVINADGTGLRKLIASVSRTAYGVDTPAWSVSNRIAYARYLPSQHRTEIYTVNADGSGNASLTRGAPGFGQPSWSPDGKSIAFVASPGSASGIEVATANGTGGHRVSPRAWTSYSPTWTPGGKIVFLRQIGARTQSTAAPTSAYIVNRDGSGLRLLYSDLDASQIAWGPTTLPRATCLHIGQ